ncbi:hypothetical protein RDWZM_009080 [Blomia tropicalis]|uniref:Uncharacterized protein n=1 Tax=Blomia tropicalis TaxID=40697 RepID=A0A9Q0M0Q0_BLOTA|nr:hypothetical protein RDWZM_009080 [Blomia tropicalis]
MKKMSYEDEVMSHNIDSKHFPHQYAIQIRWGKPGQANEAVNPGDRYRTMNDENSKYRQYAHQEEEHWHDKKWINIGKPPSGERNGLEGEFVVNDEKFNTLPIYARPMKNGSNLKDVREHFAVPSQSFPVAKRFTKWANEPVRMRSRTKPKSNRSIGKRYGHIGWRRVPKYRNGRYPR